MASINSLSSSSSSSSIYGNRNYNIISGLASGLDTEELISGLVQSYQQKIQSLQKKNTKLQWEQEAIQNISNKLVEFDRNYTSYAYSQTNLLSPNFFNSAVNTTTNGDFAALISASGKTSSEVVINAVKQLATAARYTVSGSNLNPNSADGTVVTGNVAVNMSAPKQLSNMSGSLSLTYGDKRITLDFSSDELFGDSQGNLDTAKLQSAIEKKLSEQQITTSSGTTSNADTLIGVSVDASGAVTFTDKSGAGNAISITGATGDLADRIQDLDSVVEDKSNQFSFSDTTNVVETTTVAEYLAGKTLTVSLDGKSKTIELPTVDPNKPTSNNDFLQGLQAALDKAFGADRKITADFDSAGNLSFTLRDTGSNLSVTSSDAGVGEALGIGGGISSYLNTSKTLGDLNIDWDQLTSVEFVDEDGNKQTGYELVINGEKIGTYTKDTELSTVLNNINANSEAGVNVSYSKTTGQFVFTAKETGSGGRIEIQDGLGAALFGTVDPSQKPANYSEGKDAEFIATINGQTTEFTRSSNTFDVDGMSVTLNGTFNTQTTVDDVDKLAANQSVTFTSKTDADTIVNAVKSMVDDLNEIIKAVKSAYSDMPLQKSDGSKYEPLSDDDMADMSDSAIENYEEKAKTGILFMDRDLSSLYNDLRNAITASGLDSSAMRSIGLETSYSDGLTTLTLNEQTLREALASDPDKVEQVFTQSKSSGSSVDGLMTTLQKVTTRYASTTGATKGILIEKAGSKYSPSALLDNTILDQMEDVEDEIAKWQDKMSTQVDYYTNKFTQLEMLINQMNSQSSALAGLMGG